MKEDNSGDNESQISTSGADAQWSESEQPSSENWENNIGAANEQFNPDPNLETDPNNGNFAPQNNEMDASNQPGSEQSNQEASMEQLEEMGGRERMSPPPQTQQDGMEGEMPNNEIQTDAEEENYQDLEAEREKTGEDLEQKKKLSFFDRFFPTQSITLILIIALALFFFCLLATLVPIKSKKADIIEYFKSIGIDASINGNVYFNPFLMSYTVSAANLHMVGGMRDGKSCAPELNLKTEQVYLGILTKNVKLLGAQIEAVTGGDSSKMYGFIKSILAGKNFVSKIETKNAIVSITSCPSLTATDQTAEPSAPQPAQQASPPDRSKPASKAPEATNISKLASLSVVDFSLRKSAKDVDVSANILLEGIPIKLVYENSKNLKKKILVSSSFANLSYYLDITGQGPRKKAGSYALIISDGNSFAKTMGIRPFEEMYGVVSNTTMKIAGDLDLDANGDVVFANNAALSQGLGSIAGSFSPKSRLFEAKIDFPVLDFRYKDLKKQIEPSFGYVSLWKVIFRMMKGADHKINISVGKVITNQDSFQDFKLSYLLQKEILSPDDFYFAVKNNHFEISSAKEDSSQSSAIDDATAQIVQSAKNKKRSIIDTRTVIPIQVKGSSIAKLFYSASQLFGDPNTARSNVKEIRNPKSFNGEMDFFFDYKDGDYGFQDINIVVNNIGLISGSYIFDNELSSGGVIDTVTKIDLSIEKVDLSDILNKNVVWDFIDPIIPKDKGSWLFNFTRNTESEKNYDIKILLQRTLYKTKKIARLDFHTIKKPRYFEIAKLEGNSEIFDGNARLVVDATSAKPIARGFADIGLLNIAAFLDNNEQDPIKTDNGELKNVKNMTFQFDAKETLPQSNPEAQAPQGISLPEKTPPTENEQQNNQNLPSTTIPSPVEAIPAESDNAEPSPGAANPPEEANPTTPPTETIQPSLTASATAEESFPKQEAEVSSPSSNTVEITPATPEQAQPEEESANTREAKNPDEELFDFGDEALVRTTSKAKKRPFDKYEEEPRMLPYFEDIDGDFDISISSIIMPNRIISPLIINLDIDSGRFLLKRLMIGSGDMQIESNASFTLNANANIRGRVVAKNLPLNPIMKFFLLECKTGGSVDTDIKFYSKGRNIKTLVKNMNAEIGIESKDMYITYPNLSGIYSALSSSQNMTFLDLDSMIKQEKRSEFKQASGKIQVKEGIVSGANISMRSVGYSGVFNFVVNLSTSDIEFAKTNFVVLGYKPWSKSFRAEDRFINIPISLAISGNLSGTKYNLALDRVREYLSEVDKWKKESSATAN